MQLALSGTNPAALVADEFTQKRVVDVPGLDVVILDTHGTILYTSECDTTTAAGVVTHPDDRRPASRDPSRTSSARCPPWRMRSRWPRRSQCEQAPTVIAASPSATALCPSGVEGVEVLSRRAAGARCRGPGVQRAGRHLRAARRRRVQRPAPGRVRPLRPGDRLHPSLPRRGPRAQGGPVHGHQRRSDRRRGSRRDRAADRRPMPLRRRPPSPRVPSTTSPASAPSPAASSRWQLRAARSRRLHRRRGAGRALRREHRPGRGNDRARSRSPR